MPPVGVEEYSTLARVLLRSSISCVLVCDSRGDMIEEVRRGVVVEEGVTASVEKSGCLLVLFRADLEDGFFFFLFFLRPEK